MRREGVRLGFQPGFVDLSTRLSIDHLDFVFFFFLFLQVQFKGKTIKLNLRINTLLFGSDFTTERYKEDGTIERTKSSDLHCYLVGETESFYSSVAISDCDGLVRILLSRIYA